MKIRWIGVGCILLVIACSLSACSGNPQKEKRITSSEIKNVRSKRERGSIYKTDTFLRSLPDILPEKSTEWTPSEQSNISNIVRVVDSNNFDAWKRARIKLIGMGNSAIDHYILAMVQRLVKDSKHFTNADLDQQRFDSRGSWEDVMGSLEDRRFDKDTKYLDDDIWEIVRSEFIEIGTLSVRPLLTCVQASPNAVQSYVYGEILAAIGEPAIPYLVAAVRDTDDNNFRYRLVYLLRYFPDRIVSQTLAAVLELAGNAVLRAQAADSLVFAGMSTSIPRIQLALQREPEDYVRKMTIYALGHMADTNALVIVRDYLKDPSAKVRGQAAMVLGVKKHMPAVPDLIKALDAALARSEQQSEAMTEVNHIAKALSILSGRNYGFDTQQWRRWYAVEKLKQK